MSSALMGSQAGSWMELRGQQTPRSRLCQRSASLGPGHVLGPHSWAAVPLESDPISGTGLQPIKPGAPSSPHRQAAPAPHLHEPRKRALLQPGEQCPPAAGWAVSLLQPGEQCPPAAGGQCASVRCSLLSGPRQVPGHGRWTRRRGAELRPGVSLLAHPPPSPSHSWPQHSYIN